ncbi:TPA: hypothetical protein QCY44_001267 [Bacillus cereus]|nr:hypothetical protein BC2903_22230 [Bacillus cereus]HDR7976941.1 hypothetical protein [Bacillus cereus]
MGKHFCPLKLGKEKFGELKVKDAYLKAFKLYFGRENSSSGEYKMVHGTKSNDKLDLE